MGLRGDWPEKLVAVGCALLLAGALTQARATTKKSTSKAASGATKAATHSSGSAKGAKTPKHTSSQKGKRSKKTAGWRKRGQQKIDGQRAREIQEALIREHYLDGKASGVWDDASQNAMERYQADNGWQSKTVPDSRALIKLGLGPDHEHLLNPESAMTTVPTPGPTKDAASSSPPQK
ncbi:MAG: peptidoglycan-binding protein [Acidobacteriia bacterium]|nr:peptidoglycan-binding protein [Terriglobia bacterium]